MSVVRSFFNHYGILSLPIVSMTIFGQFGLRPRQTKYKCLAYFLDIWFLGSFIIFCVGTIGQFLVIFEILGGFKDIINIFVSGFTIITFVLFIMWGVVSFKKYNVFCLLDEVIHMRKNSLSKVELMCVTTAYCIYLVMLFKYSVQAVIMTVSWSLSNTSDFYTSMSIIIRSIVFGDIIWMLLWNISVLICLLSLIISREFQECTRDLESGLDEEGLFPCKLFHKTVERFGQLILVVNKLEEMFSLFVGILLVTTLSLIFGTIYYVAEKRPFETWDSLLVFSVLILAVLLSSLATLNHRVRKEFSNTLLAL